MKSFNEFRNDKNTINEKKKRKSYPETPRQKAERDTEAASHARSKTFIGKTEKIISRAIHTFYRTPLSSSDYDNIITLHKEFDQAHSRGDKKAVESTKAAIIKWHQSREPGPKVIKLLSKLGINV